MDKFELVAPFKPTGDQPAAIAELVAEARAGKQCQTLLGVTGSGKTFTVANVIAQLNRPALVFSHNKTLAAQLYGELKAFFPNNAVEFYISYYDYYQPEAFIPATNTYIEKDTSVNEEIERLRLRATCSLLTREDVIVVASVSAIYGIGNPITFREGRIPLKVGLVVERDDLLAQLVSIRYARNDLEPDFGTFRARGDIVEIRLAFEERVLRVEFFGDEIEAMSWVEPLTGRSLGPAENTVIYPATQFVTGKDGVGPIVDKISRDLEDRLTQLDEAGKPLEAQRLASRTRYDMEMIQQIGHCAGVENYSRYFDKRTEGDRPACLLDYFPKDYLMMIDESHA
ncbi:MAG: excinuclease ABC subunit B, partial [Candidatus Krumholzibacteriia bacterium]